MRYTCGDCGTTLEFDALTAGVTPLFEQGWDYWAYLGTLCPACLDGKTTKCVECRQVMTRRQSLRHVHVTQLGKF